MKDKRLQSQYCLSVSIIRWHHSEDNAVRGEVWLVGDLTSVSFEGSEWRRLKNHEIQLGQVGGKCGGKGREDGLCVTHDTLYLKYV